MRQFLRNPQSADTALRQYGASPMHANNQPPCPTLPDDAVASVLAHLGLRELHLCAHLSAAWRVQANARRNALRLLQHESAYGVRGNSRDKLHNAGSLALVGGGAALLVSEEKLAEDNGALNHPVLTT